jgi:hypothetical protein
MSMAQSPGPGPSTADGVPHAETNATPSNPKRVAAAGRLPPAQPHWSNVTRGERRAPALGASSDGTLPNTGGKLKALEAISAILFRLAVQLAPLSRNAIPAPTAESRANALLGVVVETLYPGRQLQRRPHLQKRRQTPLSLPTRARADHRRRSTPREPGSQTLQLLVCA